ncbi:SRPBCC family protein [Nocardia sp. alder85J]|uniref:SRPBCC family protein n=1 Tax=Nocardia sp. alder85J TaxID=2862949 RepID=UPI001CD2E19D|nr:SRPBCC family protein [Nocardia sp. alder85J]MCX4092485.1 SRPBCC family protein [Nocardia sp. alder85J]
MSSSLTKTITAAVLGGASFLGGLAVGYPLFARAKVLTWGASGEEIARLMPGDELLPEAAIVTTRAISICAGPETIWPWLVQFGPGRGGVYSYDWIDQLLGVPMHSADTILPEYQRLTVGETFGLAAEGPRMRVEILEPQHALVFRSEDHNWVWSFGLYPVDGGTRLVSRNRIATADASPATRVCYRYLLEPGSLIMERKMLQGIKNRAERSVPPRTVKPASAIRHDTTAPTPR